MSLLPVNMRYGLMSSYLATFFHGKSFFERLLAVVLLTDETFGVAAQYAQTHGRIPFPWLLGLNLTAYGNWTVANLCRALLASSMPSAITKELGFSLTAMFVGLFLMTTLGSRSKAVDAFVIVSAMAVALIVNGHVDPKDTVLIATIPTAKAGTAVVTCLRRVDRVPE